jgi:hypothetical protein
VLGEIGDGAEGEAMHKHRQVSEFQEYVNSRDRKIKRALSEIEKRGAATALHRCRVLAEQIDGDLGNTKLSELFNNISLLAEFQVSIERAASVLDSIAALTYNQQEDWSKPRRLRFQGCLMP